MNKETDICFCQNVRFLFGICSLESHCSEGGFTPLLFRQQTKTLFRQAWNAMYNPQIQISAESETKRSIFREKDKTKRSKKESAQHSKSRNKSFVMTSVSAL